MIENHFPPLKQKPAIFSDRRLLFDTDSQLFPKINNVDTKLKGDIAEQAAALHALKRGWGVLNPIGDRLGASRCMQKYFDARVWALAEPADLRRGRLAPPTAKRIRADKLRIGS